MKYTLRVELPQNSVTLAVWWSNRLKFGLCHASCPLTITMSSTAKPPVSSNRAPSRSYVSPSSSVGSETGNRRIPVTPAVLRSIFASSRTVMEERSISRVTFFRFVESLLYCTTQNLYASRAGRFAGFVLSCVMISVAAARNRGRPAVGMLAMI